MSYFKSKTGQKPNITSPERPQTTKSTFATKPAFAAKPAFATSLGQRPPQPSSGSSQSAQATTAITLTKPCPLCQGEVLNKGGLYYCQGRCQATWWRDSTGQLIDLAALPLGICRCCNPPQALVPATPGAICPDTSQVYLLLSEGPVPLAEAAPHGLCHCCQPALPLEPHEDGLICPAKPYHRYEEQAGQVVLLAPQGGFTTAATLAAIDEALRHNTAQLTVNGLFDFD
jgi:hypothetical protein